jgi:MarR family transcriptional regulator, organic hydroperoxide resistance regulator
MSDQLQGYIGYHLLQALRAHRRLAEAAFSEIGLYPGQEMLLFQLWQEEGVTQSQLVEKLCVEPPTVTKTLQRLEKAGIIERKQDPEDARVSRVFLTPKGEALKEQVQKIWRDLEARTTKNLSEVEQAFMLRLLEQITKNLSK